MELGEGFKLCSGSCIGAAPGKDGNEILLAFDAGSVQVYDAVSHNCVCSWQLPSDQCLCSPAIYHPPSQRYWVVRHNRWTKTSNAAELLSWRCGNDMLAGKSVPLPESQIFTLLATGTTKLPAVVYLSGGVAVGGANPQLHKKEKRSPLLPRVLLADTVQCGDVEYVCIVCAARDGDSSSTSVRLWTLSGGQAQPLPPSNLTITSGVTECCVCGMSLITITTDGRLYSWNIFYALRSQSLTPIHQSTITPPPSKSHLVSMSCDYFVLVGVVSEGIQLSIWDVSYLTNQAGTILSISAPPRNVCCTCGCVLVCGGDVVMLVETKERRTFATLAAALGRGQSSATIHGGHIPEACVEDCCLLSMEDVQKCSDLVSILTDRTKTSTLEQFMKEFTLVPELDYSLVVRRLLGETEFWAREAFLCLLRNNMFPSSLVGEILAAALDNKDWVLVSVVLSQCSDCVPESDLVKLLEAALKLPESLDGGVTREELLISLLSVPVNDASLYLPLSQLPFHYVVLLLEWLCSQVDMAQLLAHPDSAPSQQLSYDRVLDWISVLLDVQFTQLALQPQARQLIVKLHSTIFQQVKCLDYLSIVGAAQHMTKAKPTNSDNWLYKIEKLPINI